MRGYAIESCGRDCIYTLRAAAAAFVNCKESVENQQDTISICILHRYW